MSATWTVITVTYNSARDLAHSWSAGTRPDSVDWVVVDNVSSDESVSLARHLGARVIENTVNAGFGAGNNIGFVESESEYVLFVNPDVRVEWADLSHLEEWLDENPRSLVAPQLLNPDGSAQPNGRGPATLANKVRNRLRPALGAGSYTFSAATGEICHVDWLMGACVAGRRSWLHRLGPWDPRFFVYYEDSDLGVRNELAGGRSTVLGSCRWVHGWARETASPSLRAWKLEFASMAKFYSRYPELLFAGRLRRGGV